MKSQNKKRQEAARDRIVKAIEGRKTETVSPLIVALDGPSGSGKSTLAAQVAAKLDAALIHLDDFFAADVPDQLWDSFSIPERLDRVFQWERVRTEVLLPLRSGEPARWRAFDFDGGLRPDGTYRASRAEKVARPRQVVILEGAYSASPNLVDLIDMAILIDVHIGDRQARLKDREDPDFLARWHALWDGVEAYYWASVRPREWYELVIEMT